MALSERHERITEPELLRRVQRLRVWRRTGERAPHKPLLLLLALAKVHRGQKPLWSFRELDQALRRLLKHYGPPRRAVHPEYPFWRLERDGLWEVERREHVRRTRSGDPLRESLLELDIRGGFPVLIYQAFRTSPRLRETVIRTLLDAHFPRSLHQEILLDLGLPATLAPQVTTRDLYFRIEVLRAYEYRCAVCSFNVRLGERRLGLEAAHIKWRQAGGPNTVRNGLALCAIHHKAFDLGAWGLADDLRILVSADVHDGTWAAAFFYEFQGRQVRRANRAHGHPAVEFVRWHRREVFRGPARDR